MDFGLRHACSADCWLQIRQGFCESKRTSGQYRCGSKPVGNGSPSPGLGMTLRNKKRNGGTTIAAPPRSVATLSATAFRKPPGLKASLYVNSSPAALGDRMRVHARRILLQPDCMTDLTLGEATGLTKAQCKYLAARQLTICAMLQRSTSPHNPCVHG